MAIKINGNTVIDDSQNFTSIGSISATGNITGGNIIGNVLSTGPISTTGNVTGGNINTGGQVSAAANVVGQNILTGGIISSVGNIFSAANIRGANIIAQGTLDAANVNATGTISAVGLVLGNIITSTSGEFGIASNITTLSLANTQATTTWITGNASNVYIGNTNSFTRVQGNLTVGGTISATGNITGNYFIGNGSQLTGIDATAIQNGTANVRTFLNGNVTTSAGGTANVLNVTSTGTITTGTASVSGTVTGGNIATAGTVSATGALTGSTLTAGGFTLTGNSIVSNNATITIDPNASGGVDGAVVIAGNLSVQGNVTYIDSNVITTNEKSITLANNQSTGAALDGSGIDVGNANQYFWRFNNATTSWQANIGITPSANATLNLGGASNYWGNAFIVTASVAGNVTGGNILTAGVMSSTGNGIHGNVLTGGLISATGNITGSFFFGNGSQLTGIDATSIQNGTSNVRVVSSGGNVAMGIGGTANVVVVATTGQFVTGVNSVSGNVTGGNILTAGLISAAGALITGGDHSLTGNIVDTGALFINTGSNGNITLNPNGTGVIVVNKDIVNGQANGTGNIGSATTYFNTVFAKATSAQYADLAEKYTADADYAPGTVVMFGGSAEVTLCANDGCSRVAGVISTNPSYIMNGTLEAAHVATVALTGRVPTRVTGTVRKGDLMVSAGNGSARAEANPRVGTVIGKALADHDGAEGVIEVVVGRF